MKINLFKETFDLQELLNCANNKFNPLIWKIEGPYLYVSNYGCEINKENSLAYYPNIKSLKDKKEFIEEAKIYIERHSIFLLSKPEDRNLKLNNDNKLKEARKIWKKLNQH